MASGDPTGGGVRVVPGGIALGSETIPFLAGTIHAFRTPRSTWQDALRALVKVGMTLVDVPVPWSAHERAKGAFDFGRTDPRLDVRAFLGLADELGLRAMVRPGPFVRAELVGDGIPLRVLRDPRCQALSPRGTPVPDLSPPLAVPVASLASGVFIEECAAWLAAVAAELAPLAWPAGPVVIVGTGDAGPDRLVDAAIDRDHHPDAVAAYRRFLAARYGGSSALGRAHRDPEARLETAEPPRVSHAEDPEGLPRRLDLALFRESLSNAFHYRVKRALGDGGLRVPFLRDVPRASGGTDVDPERAARGADVVLVDAGPPPDPTTQVVALVRAGFPPWGAPRSEEDDLRAAIAALALGAEGLVVDGFVRHDRWVGGLADGHGRLGDVAGPWRALAAALVRTDFARLVRRADVEIVVPRSLARICRASALVGHPLPRLLPAPLDAADLVGDGALDPTGGGIGRARGFFCAIDLALRRAHLTSRVVGSWCEGDSADGPRWRIVISPGFLEPTLLDAIVKRLLVGEAVSVGPLPPIRDEHLRPARNRLPALREAKVPVLIEDVETLDRVVSSAIDSLGLDGCRLAAEPLSVKTTLFSEPGGRARVLFVVNEGDCEVEAIAAAPGARQARDALTGEDVLVTGEHAVLALARHQVRMLELSR